MPTPARPTPVRGARAVVAGLAAAAFLTACSGDDGSDAAPRSTGAASTAAATDAPDLASGLLPAAAFGPDASVTAITREQLRQGAGLVGAGGQAPQITPAECAAAVQGAQPTFADFGDVAAESATSGTATTVEVLVRGGPTADTVALLAGAAERCPQAQLTAPQFGQATVTFENLPVDDLGNAAALLRYTTAVTLPGGAQATVPALVGAVQDGDRLLVLTTLDTSGIAGTGTAAGSPDLDAAAFGDLLRQAYEAQADALD
ncbi:MAG: uncharacterized protein JWR82_1500 [Blastococcus sp.]|nr:uncharacterized protein [Blastococcus sp.]